MIDLYTASTPNGHKVSIALEEMGLDYHVIPISLTAGDQKKPEFLAINPNGRIPAIVDRDAGDLAVFESGAILIYLAEKTGKFLPTEARARASALQWLMFQMSGLGPMMGQANVFLRYAPEKLPYAIGRYQREGRRLFEVMNGRLAEAEFLAGDYSIADMASWPWVHGHEWCEIPIDGLDHLQRWLRVVGERPAVMRGKEVPDGSGPPQGQTLQDVRDTLLV